MAVAVEDEAVVVSGAEVAVAIVVVAAAGIEDTVAS